MTTRDYPVVLAVDDNEGLLATYEMWLGDAYELRTAESGEAALAAIDEDVQVVLLDRLMPGMSGDEVLEEIRRREFDCQVAMVTAVEPDFDIADMPFDAYVPKALERETVQDTVERLVARAEYDEAMREHYAVAEKLAMIEDQKTATELSQNERYQALLDRFEELDAAVEERSDALAREDILSAVGADERLGEQADGGTDERGETL